MQEIEIRKVTLNELDQLQSISRITFAETFGSQNTPEDLSNYLHENLSAEKLLQELTNPDSEFYFAMLNNEAIGYLKLNSGQAQTDLREEDALEIERIYVLSTYLGKNIGQALLQKAIALGRKYKASFVWLGVWERNVRAIRFYEKSGFVAFGNHTFMLGHDAQTDLLMKLELY